MTTRPKPPGVQGAQLLAKLFQTRESRLNRYFDDLELELVIPKLLAHVFNPKNCENAVWITAAQYRLMKERDPNAENETEQHTLKHLRLQAFKPLDEMAVGLHLKNFEAQVSMSSVVNGADGRADLLCPILDETTREPMAYVLLVGVVARQVERLRSRLDYDLGIMARHIRFSLRFFEAQRLSYMDDLTGLFNQKFMSMVLENEIFRAQREDLKFSVLFMDVDYFKAINDSRGHLTGSRLLVEVAKILKSCLRRSDYAFRYGGDEFVVILPITGSNGAKITAERIRERIEKTDFVVDGAALKLTLSIGIATFPDHAKTHKDIIKMADEAMYCGKNKSRNIVFVAS